MSRTYRRKKSGNRYWINYNHSDSHFKNFKNKKAMLRYFESDNYDGYGSGKKLLKELSKDARRSKEKQQLSKIMKSHNDVHLYDDSFENSQMRNLIWHCY